MSGLILCSNIGCFFASLSGWPDLAELHIDDMLPKKEQGSGNLNWCTLYVNLLSIASYLEIII